MDHVVEEHFKHPVVSYLPRDPQHHPFTEDVSAVPVIKAIISLCGGGVRQLSQHQLQAPSGLLPRLLYN